MEPLEGIGKIFIKIRTSVFELGINIDGGAKFGGEDFFYAKRMNGDISKNRGGFTANHLGRGVGGVFDDEGGSFGARDVKRGRRHHAKSILQDDGGSFTVDEFFGRFEIEFLGVERSIDGDKLISDNGVNGGDAGEGRSDDMFFATTDARFKSFKSERHRKASLETKIPIIGVGVGILC